MASTIIDLTSKMIAYKINHGVWPEKIAMTEDERQRVIDELKEMGAYPVRPNSDAPKASLFRGIPIEIIKR